MNWVIIGKGADEGLLWSNSLGWVENAYDVFTDEEKRVLRLPVGGAWCSQVDISNSIKIREILFNANICTCDNSFVDMLNIYKQLEDKYKNILLKTERVFEKIDKELEKVIVDIAVNVYNMKTYLRSN